MVLPVHPLCCEQVCSELSVCSVFLNSYDNTPQLSTIVFIAKQWPPTIYISTPTLPPRTLNQIPRTHTICALAYTVPFDECSPLSPAHAVAVAQSSLIFSSAHHPLSHGPMTMQVQKPSSAFSFQNTAMWSSGKVPCSSRLREFHSGLSHLPGGLPPTSRSIKNIWCRVSIALLHIGPLILPHECSLNNNSDNRSGYMLL